MIALPPGPDAPVLLHGDCLALLRDIPDASVDVVITDPPAGIGFMGKGWDSFAGYEPVTERGRDINVRLGGLLPAWAVGFVAFMTDVWAEVDRVLKPGGFVCAWALPKTADLAGLAMRAVGWTMHDNLVHLFGCLTDDAEILTDIGWVHSRNLDRARLALCYDVDRGTYEWQPIERSVRFPFSGTAYRVHGDGVDHTVTPDHRCVDIGPDGGRFIDAIEAASQPSIHVPVPDGLRGLRFDVASDGDVAGLPPQDVQQGVRGQADRASAAGAQDATEDLQDLRSALLAAESSTELSVLLTPLLRAMASDGPGYPRTTDDGRAQGPGGWTAASMASYSGPRYVRCPESFRPMARADGYVMEHRLVMARALCRLLTRTEVVHHMNHDPRDNRLINLALFRTNRDQHGTLGGMGNRWDQDITAPATPEAQRWDGWGTALAPGHEQWLLARKPTPLTYARQVLAHGCGAMNIDACRTPTNGERVQSSASVVGGYGGDGGTYEAGDGWRARPDGYSRWPCNAMLSEGGERCPVAELDRQSGHRPSSHRETRRGSGTLHAYGSYHVGEPGDGHGGHEDVGGASRFFPRFRYQAKAHDRTAGLRSDVTNKHPTHKSVELMRWLVRLLAAKAEHTGGDPAIVLDPFMGSGTTGIACVAERVRFIGIERDPVRAADHDSFGVAVSRIMAAIGSPEAAAEANANAPTNAQMSLL